jgi:hypothetical protein
MITHEMVCFRTAEQQRMSDLEQQDSASASEDRRTIDLLREAFGATTNRLTPEVEPATIYVPYVPVSDEKRPVESAE